MSWCWTENWKMVPQERSLVTEGSVSHSAGLKDHNTRNKYTSLATVSKGGVAKRRLSSVSVELWCLMSIEVFQ